MKKKDNHLKFLQLMAKNNIIKTKNLLVLIMGLLIFFGNVMPNNLFSADVNPADVNPANVNPAESLNKSTVTKKTTKTAATTAEKKQARLNRDLFQAIWQENLDMAKEALDKGADFNAINYNGDTFVMEATRLEKADILKYLVDLGADVQVKNLEGDTALSLALAGKDLAKVKCLVENGADTQGVTIDQWVEVGFVKKVKEALARGEDPNATNIYGEAILMRALDNQDLEMVKGLVEHGANIHIKDENGQAPLVRLSMYNTTEIVKILVENGADINVKNENGDTPLRRVARIDNGFATLKYLVDNGADVRAKNLGEGTALSLALVYGSPQMVEYLVEHGADTNGVTVTEWAEAGYLKKIKEAIAKGADVNTKNKYGDTLLMVASENMNLEVVKYLVDSGANVNVKNLNGRTPLLLSFLEHWNKGNGYGEVENLVMVKYLVAKGADVNATDRNRNTALWEAFHCGYFNTADYLISQGADPGKRSIGEWVEIGFFKKVKEAVANGEDVNEVPKDDSPALINALHHNNLDMVKYLVANGADVNIKDFEGHTPLMVASASLDQKLNRLEEMDPIQYLRKKITRAQYLLDNGADINAKNLKGETALRLALDSRSGMGSLVAKYLVDRGADSQEMTLEECGRVGIFKNVKEAIDSGQIEAKAESGQALLLLTAQHPYPTNNGHLDIVQYLLDNGASVEAKNKALAGQRHLDIMKCLVGNGADINVRDQNDQTLLMTPSSLARTKYLVENGAEVTAQDKHGNTAVLLAAMRGDFHSVEYLLESGADFNIKGEGGSRALQRAIVDGNLGAVKYLVEKGADLNAQYKNPLSYNKGRWGLGSTPLLESVMKGMDWDSCGHLDLGDYHKQMNTIAKYLVEQGAKDRVKTGYGYTALMLAVANRNLDVVKALVESGGADVHLKNKKGQTALDIAKASNRKAIIPYLESVQ